MNQISQTTSTRNLNPLNLVAKALGSIKPSEAATVNGAASAARRCQMTLQRASVLQDMQRKDDLVDAEVSIQPEALEPLASRLSSWKSHLGEVVAGLNKCKAYTIYSDKGTRMILVGSATDAPAVRHLYRVLCTEVDRLTVIFGTGKGRTWCNNFRLSTVNEIAKELREGARVINEEIRAEVASDPEVLARAEGAISARARRVDAVAAWMNIHHKKLTEAAMTRSDIREPAVWDEMEENFAPPIPLRRPTNQGFALWRYKMGNVFTKEERQIIALARKAAYDPHCDLLPQEIIGDLLAIMEAAEMRAFERAEAERPRLTLSKNES